MPRVDVRSQSWILSQSRAIQVRQQSFEVLRKWRRHQVGALISCPVCVIQYYDTEVRQ